METLRDIYEQHSGRLLNKWDHYIEVYDSYFSKYRNKPITFLEIGIAHGGSLRMWRKYFGEQAQIIAVDVNPETKKFEEERTKIYIGSQEDKKFLSQLKTLIPTVDILLDDGGHTMKQQITTFESLFNHVKEDGLYVCEDLHTSYWDSFGGGYKKKTSFIEYSKNFIDYLHAWHVRKRYKKKMYNSLTESIYGIHYFDSIMVIEKRKILPPQNTFKGVQQLEHHFEHYGEKKSLIETLRVQIKSLFSKS